MRDAWGGRRPKAAQSLTEGFKDLRVSIHWRYEKVKYQKKTIKAVGCLGACLLWLLLPVRLRKAAEPDRVSLFGVPCTITPVIYQSGDVMCCAALKLGRRSHKDGHSERQDGNNADNLGDAAPPMRGEAWRRGCPGDVCGIHHEKYWKFVLLF